MTLAVKVALNPNTTNQFILVNFPHVKGPIDLRVQQVVGQKEIFMDPEFCNELRGGPPHFLKSCKLPAKIHSLVGCIQNLRTGSRRFDPRLDKLSFQGLIIDIATGFISLSPLSIISTVVIWESSQWLGKNIVRSNSKKNSKKAWIGALPATM